MNYLSLMEALTKHDLRQLKWPMHAEGFSQQALALYEQKFPIDLFNVEDQLINPRGNQWHGVGIVENDDEWFVAKALKFWLSMQGAKQLGFEPKTNRGHYTYVILEEGQGFDSYDTALTKYDLDNIRRNYSAGHIAEGSRQFVDHLHITSYTSDYPSFPWAIVIEWKYDDESN